MKEQPFSIDYWYRILGLRMDATAQDAKSAHRHLARQFHPDLNPGNKNAEERFKEVQQAYELVLKNIQQRSTSSYSDHEPSNQNPTQGVRVRVDVYRATQSSKPGKDQASNPTQRHNPESSVSPSFFEVQQLKLNLIQKLQNWLADAQWNQVIQEIQKLGLNLQRSPEICSITAEAYYGLSKEYASREKYEQAHICIQKAVKTDPYRHKYWQEIEQQYRWMAQQNFHQIKTELEKSSQAEPQDVPQAEPLRQPPEESVNESKFKTILVNEEKGIVQDDIASTIPQVAKTWMQNCWANHRLETFALIAFLGLLGSILIHQVLNNHSSSFDYQRTEVSRAPNVRPRSP